MFHTYAMLCEGKPSRHHRNLDKMGIEGGVWGWDNFVEGQTSTLEVVGCPYLDPPQNGAHLGHPPKIGQYGTIWYPCGCNRSHVATPTTQTTLHKLYMMYGHHVPIAWLGWGGGWVILT